MGFLSSKDENQQRGSLGCLLVTAVLAAYCLLVEENLAIRPAYGIIQYPERQFTVPYTDELRRELLQVMEHMQLDAELAQGPHPSHSNPRRCAVCGVRDACLERLDQRE